MEQTELKERRYVGVRETLIYGVANGGQVIGYNLVRMQLTFFLVTVFGIPGQAVSLMIFFMGIWDTMNDPIMGTIVDKTRTRYGKLRPYLLFVPIPLGVATILFFGGAEFLRGVESTTAKIVYMCITYFIWEFFYTIGDIPFWGMSAAISPNPKDRSRVITSARLISGAIGGLVGPVISIFIDLQKSGKIGMDMRQLFFILGIVAGTFGMGLFSLAGLCTKERVMQQSEEPKISDCFKCLVKNKPLLLIVCSNVLGTVESIADAFTQYFYLFTLGSASLSIVAGIPGTITGFLAYTFIPALERRWTSKQIVIRAVIVKAVVSSAIFLIGAHWYRDPRVIVPLMMVWGVFNSAVSSIKMVIPTKMIGDTVDYMENQGAQRRHLFLSAHFRQQAHRLFGHRRVRSADPGDRTATGEPGYGAAGGRRVEYPFPALGHCDHHSRRAESVVPDPVYFLRPGGRKAGHHPPGAGTAERKPDRRCRRRRIRRSLWKTNAPSAVPS